MDLPVGFATASEVHGQSVFFGYKGVLAETSDNGQSWIYHGFSDVTDADVEDILIDRTNQDRWYLAVGIAGLLMSEDRGRSWMLQNEGLNLGKYDHGYIRILQDNYEESTFYLLSVFEAYKSTDAGKSWNRIFNGLPEDATGDPIHHPTALLIDKNIPNTLYLFTREDPKRFVSINGGDTWRSDSSKYGILENVMYGPGEEVLVGNYRTNDYGKSWTDYSNWIGEPPHWTTDKGKCVYARNEGRYFWQNIEGLFWMNEEDSVWRRTGLVRAPSESFYNSLTHLTYSETEGKLFGCYKHQIVVVDATTLEIDTLRTGPKLPEVEFIASSTPNNHRIATNAGSTKDNGASWEVEKHLFKHSTGTRAAISPKDSMFAIFSSGLGLSYSTEGYENLTGGRDVWKISRAMQAPCWYRFHFNPHNPREVYGGSMIGLWRLTDSVMINSTVPNNGSSHIISPREPNGTPSSNYKYKDMAFDPNQDGIYYLCSYEITQYGDRIETLWRSEDYGESWNALVDMRDTPFTRVVVNPVDPDIILVATYEGLLRSSDRGASWYLVDNHNFGALGFTDIVIDPLSPNIYYCSSISMSGPYSHQTSGKRPGGIYRSTDFGETWTAMSTDGMYSVSVGRLYYHENPRRLYAGTSAGLYEYLLGKPSGINEDVQEHKSPSPEWTVSPNPVYHGENAVIELFGGIDGIAALKLYDANGKYVKTVYTGELQNTRSISDNTSGYTPGVYYYRLTSTKNQSTKKIIVVE